MCIVLMSRGAESGLSVEGMIGQSSCGEEMIWRLFEEIELHLNSDEDMSCENLC